jgi:uncharacterized protein (TIGR01777 family)
MENETFRWRSGFEQPAREVFDWHTRPGALERLTPPWTGVSVEDRKGDIRDEGATVVLRMQMGPVSLRWVATHHDFVDGCGFRDTQSSGPFALWNHVHRMAPGGPNASVLEDSVEYRLPLAPLSSMVASGAVRAMLRQTFAWRHRRTREDLAAHSRAALAPSRIAISGATGLVGSALSAFLGTGGHEVSRLVRPGGAASTWSDGRSTTIRWDPSNGVVDASALEGMDAVVHLAGENIAAGRWSAESKDRILRSRSEGTRFLAETLARLDNKPRVLVSASAIGFYGDRGEEILDEDSRSGTGFLPEVCREWEAATEAARAAGIRTVHLRIGVVMTPTGGALARMLAPFRLGLGGPLGNGNQFLSWISLDDVLAAVLHCIATPSLEGAVNATAPRPVTSAEFARTLAAVLRRPALLRVPAPALRLLLGEMADELLLASIRVMPRRLERSGFVFRDAELAPALADMLGRPAPEVPR